MTGAAAADAPQPDDIWLSYGQFVGLFRPLLLAGHAADGAVWVKWAPVAVLRALQAASPAEAAAAAPHATRVAGGDGTLQLESTSRATEAAGAWRPLVCNVLTETAEVWAMKTEDLAARYEPLVLTDASDVIPDAALAGDAAPLAAAMAACVRACAPTAADAPGGRAPALPSDFGRLQASLRDAKVGVAHPTSPWTLAKPKLDSSVLALELTPELLTRKLAEMGIAYTGTERLFREETFTHSYRVQPGDYVLADLDAVPATAASESGGEAAADLLPAPPAAADPPPAVRWRCKRVRKPMAEGETTPPFMIRSVNGASFAATYKSQRA